MLDLPPAPLLRPLERRLLQLLGEGRSLRQVAAELSYSYPYMREVAQAAATQLGAKNSCHAVAIAARRHLI